MAPASITAILDEQPAPDAIPVTPAIHFGNLGYLRPPIARRFMAGGAATLANGATGAHALALVATIVPAIIIVIAAIAAIIAIIIVTIGNGSGNCSNPAEDQCAGNNISGIDAITITGLSWSGDGKGGRCGGAHKGFSKNVHVCGSFAAYSS